MPPPFGPVTHRPRLGRTDSSLYQGLLQYAARHGRTVGRLNPADVRGQGLGEVEHELGQAGDLERRRRLTKSLASRTTETSRTRLLNRILAGFGQTTGATGTTVPTRRF